MKLGCVYLVEGPKGSYIGKTVKPLEQRMKQHIAAAGRGEGWAFYRAYRKYPGEWRWYEVYVSDDDRALCRAEIRIIAEYKAMGVRLYNSTDGGQGTSGRTLSNETKAKIAAKAMGRASPNKGRPSPSKGSAMPEEAKDKIRVAKLEYWAKRRAAGLPLKHGSISPEGRRRLSEGAKNRWHTRRATGEHLIGAPKLR